MRIPSALLMLGLTLLAGCTTVHVPGRGPAGAPGTGFDAGDLDRFLAEFVDEHGRVDYAAALARRADLDAAVATFAAVSPDSHPERFATEADRLAYWLNAYNTWVLHLVLDAWPIESVHDVRAPLLLRFLPEGAGFFVFRRITLGGARTSLYQLENGLIRKRFPDPRIHFALNCASLGCPRLPASAFHGPELERELERETARFLAEPRNVAIDPEAGVIRLSSIFDWYERDFTRWLRRHHPDRPATLLEYVRQNGSSDLRERIDTCHACRVDFAAYDWGLNAR